MPFKKGSNSGGGRKKGAVNKTTRDIKEAFKQLVENNLDNITKWMEDVAKQNPAKALEFMQSFSQFNVPLLARTEIKSENINYNETVVIDTTGKYEADKVHTQAS